MKNPNFTFFISISILCFFYYGNIPYLRAAIDADSIEISGLFLIIVEMVAVFLLFAFSIFRQKYAVFFSWVFIVCIAIDVVFAYLGVNIGKEHYSVTPGSTFRFQNRDWTYSTISLLLTVVLVCSSVLKTKRA